MGRKRRKKPESHVPDDLIQQLLDLKNGKLNTMSAMEQAMEQLKAWVGQDGIDRLLRELPPEDGKPKPCPRCGRLVPVRREDVERTVESLSGTHTIKRHYHYCDLCKFGFFPRDAELGFPAEGNVTMELEKRLVDFGVTEVYGESAERWSVHYPHRPFSENMFRQAVDRLGTRLVLADDKLVQQELAKPAANTDDRLYVLNDGSMLPGLGGNWKESKVAAIFREQDWIRKTSTGRGQIGRARYTAVWGGQDEFREALRAALDAERWLQPHCRYWTSVTRSRTASHAARPCWEKATRLSRCGTGVSSNWWQ
jgi:hypothetical protein